MLPTVGIARNPPKAPRRCGCFVAALAGLTALGPLSACADLNPGGLFGDDSVAAPAPGAEQDFPNLATVPETPRKGSSPEEIKKIREGLVADRERARHTDQELRGNSIDEVDFAASARAAKARAEALAAASAAKAAPPSEPAQAAPDAPAGTILRFAPDSTELSNEAIERLGQLVMQFGQTGGALRVAGHAAAPSPEGAKLARNRAAVVAAELQRLGVTAERLRVIDPDPADGVAEDRVDVVIEP